MELERADIDAAAGGDRSAFERLVRASQAAVVAYALHLTGSLPDAEDVAQEALLACWLRLGDLRDSSLFEPWLRRITERQAESWRRRQRPTAPFDEEPADPRVDTRRMFERQTLSETVRVALATLSPGHREAVVLHYLGGLSQREVAGFLGITEGAVAVRLHRARLRLRDELAGLGQELRARRPAGEFTKMVMAQVVHAVSTVDQNLLVLRDGQDRTFSMRTTRDQIRAIRRALLGPERFARPEPHELLLAALRAYRVTVVEARLDRLEDSIFKATIRLDRDGERAELDARATDAITVALLAGAPLQVEEQVVEASLYRDDDGRPLAPDEVASHLTNTGVVLSVTEGYARGLLDRRPDGRWTVLVDADTAELECPPETVPDDAPESCGVWFRLTGEGASQAIEAVELYEVSGEVCANGNGGYLEAEFGDGRRLRLDYPPAVYDRLWRNRERRTTALVTPGPSGEWRLVLDLNAWRGWATAPVERSFDYLLLSGERMGLSSIELTDEGDQVVAVGVKDGATVALQTLPPLFGRSVIEHFRTVYRLAAPGDGEETCGIGEPTLFGKAFDLTLRLRQDDGRRTLSVDYAERPVATIP